MTVGGGSFVCGLSAFSVGVNGFSSSVSAVTVGGFFESSSKYESLVTSGMPWVKSRYWER